MSDLTTCEKCIWWNNTGDDFSTFCELHTVRATDGIGGRKFYCRAMDYCSWAEDRDGTIRNKFRNSKEVK